MVVHRLGKAKTNERLNRDRGNTHILPDYNFFLKSTLTLLIPKEIGRAEQEYINIPPPFGSEFNSFVIPSLLNPREMFERCRDYCRS